MQRPPILFGGRRRAFLCLPVGLELIPSVVRICRTTSTSAGTGLSMLAHCGSSSKPLRARVRAVSFSFASQVLVACARSHTASDGTSRQPQVAPLSASAWKFKEHYELLGLNIV